MPVCNGVCVITVPSQA